MNTASDQPADGIGAALKEARRRAGIDIREAEDRTKIRARYLRALEAEDWEALPADAYVRGFLRTYGNLLGIDGEALADEYRRRHEVAGRAAAGLASEPTLRERRGGRAARPPSRTPLILAIAAAIIILLVILGSISGGDDDNSSGGEHTARGLREDNAGQGEGRKPLRPVGLTLEPREDVRVCVVGDGEALIDGQMLSGGVEEEFDDFKRYRLDLPDGGAVLVRSAGAKERIDADGEVSYEADSRGIREIGYAGGSCP